jgi:hypothetical protein
MEVDVTATLGDSPDADAQAKIARAELDRIVLPVETRPLAPRELRQRNPIDYGKLNKGIRRTTSDAAPSSSSNPQADALGVTGPGPPPEVSGPLNAWLAVQMELLEKDDNIDQQTMEDTVARIFRLSEMLETPHSPEAAEAMRNALNDDSLSLKAALQIDKSLSDDSFRKAIRAEVLDNLIRDTKTLVEILPEQLALMGRYTFIHTVLKCKRKKRADNTYDKHKARMAARGDEYLRKLLQKGGHLPKCFSPTINPLTFAYVLQIAAAKNLFRASQDIKYAYLNADMPEEVEPIITKLDDDIARICGLPLGRLYRIMKAMYGLPASGRYWYLHYTERLKAEGYAQSNFVPCA